MQVTEQIIQLDSSWFSSERDVERTKGLHLSHVINFIEAQESGKTRDSDMTSLHNYAAGGYLWERLIEHLIENNPQELWDWLFTSVLSDIPNPKVIRPGEQSVSIECPVCEGDDLVKPGVICKGCNGGGYVRLSMTPDGYNIDEGVLEEYKYTSKSARSEITGPKFARWVKYQIPCYLKVLGLTKCRLRVYFSRGDYTTGQPIWKEFFLEYSNQELDEIWDSIVMNAQYMIANGLVDMEAC